MEYTIGAFLFHVWSRPGWVEVLWAVAVGVLLRLLVTFVPGAVNNEFMASPLSVGPYLAVGSFLVMTVRIFRLKGDQAEQKMRTLITAVGVAFIAPVLQLMLNINMRITPYRYDPILYAIDGTFGFQPSFLLGRLAVESRLFWNLQIFVYYTLVLAVGISYAAHAKSHYQAWPVSVIKAYAICTALAFFFYIWLPAAGPRFAFPDAFPSHAPALLQVSMRPFLLPTAPPNAIPSVHAATALLVWWNSRPWKWGRIAAGVFALLTLIATMATGEHYMIDLIVAVPYALVSQAAATTGKSLPALCTGAGLMAMWLVPARIWPQVLIGHSVTIWILALLTIAATAFIVARLLNETYCGRTIEQ